MGFLESYKKLDNLCKDLLRSEKGVASYLERMEKYRNAQYQIFHWDLDYKMLKHYRHIRNQIAHDNYANESNMSNEHDVKWIKNFYQRILNQTDPLALYETKRAHANKTQNMKTNQTNKSVHTIHNKIDINKKENICHWVYLLITILVVLIVLGIILI